ncbi:ketoreductase [Streptomyces natalensis ATCC 27448]|uniref:Ketoreductase n=1 Tax=Streptomyces natalensis ATCC 27448 TaxID=1240678 RepID=A0A0D7CL87_9ACTN|nr:ketoreductase [Streptomyces natalensis ATCC 27448]
MVVTGAGTGIGSCIAECVAMAGADVTVVGRRQAPLDELAERVGKALHAVPADITAPGAAERIIQAAVDRFGKLDAVVNNAGVARFGRLEEIDPAEFDTMLRVNVRAPAELIRCALPQLRAKRGSVVNVSSVGGALSMPGRAFYGASKAALNSLTRSLARELAPQVRVNAILPGPVDTPMWRDAGMTEAEQRKLHDDLSAATPMGRFGDGHEIGRWVCCLLDPNLSGWVTGALIPVDGGRTA